MSFDPDLSMHDAAMAEFLRACDTGPDLHDGRPPGRRNDALPPQGPRRRSATPRERASPGWIGDIDTNRFHDPERHR